MNLNSLDALPIVGDIYVVITMCSISVPGDERSRTSPGHGYSAHTVYHPSMEWFTEEEKWKEKISELILAKYGPRKSFRAFIMKSVEVSHEVKIDVG